MKATTKAWLGIIGVLMVVVALLAVGIPARAQVPVSFSKTFLPDTIGPGSVSTLRFDITNNTGTPVANLAFTDNLPAGVTIADPAMASTTCNLATLTAPDGGGTIGFSGGQVGANSTCSVFVDVTSSTPSQIPYTNTTGALTSSAGNSGTATDDLNVDTGRPGFSKSFQPSSVPLGGRSTLVFAIDNTANQNGAYELNFTDNLPVGLVIADPANAFNTCWGGVLTAVPGTNVISLFSNGFDNASVDAQSSCTISVDVTALAAGQLHNSSGELTSLAPEQQTPRSSGKANATLEVNATTLALIKEFTDDPTPPGGTVTLEFTVLNNDRDNAASNIGFTDNLNAVLPGLAAIGLPLNDVCGAGSQINGAGLLTLTGGNLPAGGSCTFSVSVQVPPGDAAIGSHSNTTSAVTGDIGGSPVTGNMAADLLFVSPVPLLTKTFSSGAVSAGGTVDVTFTISNTSPSEQITGITFADDLDAFVPGIVVSNVPAPGFCGAGSTLTIDAPPQVLSMLGGSLPAGNECSFTVTFLIPAGISNGTYTNTTSEIVALLGGEEPVVGPPASDDLTVLSGPSLSKFFTNDPVQPGDTVTLEFTLRLDNNAPGVAASITFTDDLALALAGLTATGLPLNDLCGLGNGSLTGSAGDTFLTFSGGTLSPGASCTFQVTLQVPPTATHGDYLNKTGIVNASVAGTPTTSSKARDDLRVEELTLTKEFTDDPVQPGDTVTLWFTVTNLSSASVTGISFSDDVDAMLDNTTIATSLPINNVCGAGSVLSSFGLDYLQLTGGSLGPDSFCTFSVVLNVPGGAVPGQYNNATSAVASSLAPPDSSPATDILTVFTVDPPGFTKAFAPDDIYEGALSTLSFAIDNTPSPAVASGLGFTDTLPAGVVIATPPNPSFTCGGALAAIAGTDWISYSGGSVGAGASCTVQVDVTSNTEGTHVNVSGDLTSELGNSGPATDSLTVRRTVPISLGDYVWYDTNQDGIQDGGEPGVQNIVATLYDNGACAGGQPIDSDTTDATGVYSVTAPGPGTYCIQFSNIPADWLISPQNQGGDDTVDSDADPTTGQITNITLTADDDTQDMGIFAEGSIGDTVFCDANYNNGFDAGEGVAGVTITLYDDLGCDGVSGNQVGTQDTVGDGQYLFTDVPVGPPGGPGLCYVVEVDETDLGDCNNPILPISYTVQLDADTPDDLDNDFGFNQLFSLGDYVWYDTDQDGIQDGGEPGVANITVDLYNNGDCSGGQSIASDTTDANGNYGFVNLQGSTYCIQFSNIPAGWSISPQNQGADDSVDSDADPATGQITNINLAADDDTQDMGVYAEGSIGDTVFCDANYNGQFDDGEGVAGVEVTLYDDLGCDGAAGTLVDTQDTVGDGYYTFTETMVGPAGSPVCYFVAVDEASAALGNCDNPITPISRTAQLDTANPNDLSVDFGFSDLLSLGDQVWYDTDQDGIQDAGEVGVPNITVELYTGGEQQSVPNQGGCGGQLADTDTTDAGGNYLFTGLEPGSFCIAFSNIPTGWTISPQNQGADDSLDSDADPATGLIENIELRTSDLTQDMGLYREGSVGGFVFCDANGNGTPDLGEGMGGVEVSLYDDLNCTKVAGALLGAQDSAADGSYLFDGLLTGPDNSAPVCFVAEVDETDPALGECNNPVVLAFFTGSFHANNAITVVSQPVALDAGNPDPVRHFAFSQLFSLGDRVWNDLNTNGLQDVGEPGVQGISVALYTNDDCYGSPLTTAATDANGNYGFTDLNAGIYCLAFTNIPAGWLISPQNQGADDTIDSDANPADGQIQDINLQASDQNRDMGIYQPHIEPSPPPIVPEASTLLLLGSAASGLAGYVGLQIRARRRKR